MYLFVVLWACEYTPKGNDIEEKGAWGAAAEMKDNNERGREGRRLERTGNMCNTPVYCTLPGTFYVETPVRRNAGTRTAGGTT